jgi:hypothetical protein
LNSTATITLPNGFWVGGVHQREAALHSVTGEDEAFLLETADCLPPAWKTTAILCQCLVRLGPLEPVTPEAARSLTVGDREAILLHLRRITFGDKLEAVLRCPAVKCGERMDLELKIGDLLLDPYPKVEPVYEVALTANNTAYRIRFRLPTGADQEAAVDVAEQDEEAATELVLHRCVESVIVGGEPVQPWPPIVSREIPAIMDSLDPQAEAKLTLACPSCGHTFSAIFDAAGYFFKELANRMRNLYREIHILALHYHWSERDVLAMTAKRRRLYLDLLAECRGVAT